MNLEDSNHNLRIIGRIFVIIGLICIPMVILTYNSMHFLFDSEWFRLDNSFRFGIFHFDLPWGIMYVLPGFQTILAVIMVISGFGLIQNATWSYKLSMIPAVILLFVFPVGTLLGIFLLYQLHKRESIAREGEAPTQ